MCIRDRIEGDTTQNNNSETVATASNNSANIDYTKMAVAAIREIVVTKGLANASDVSKLKKKRLLELLK